MDKQIVKTQIEISKMLEDSYREELDRVKDQRANEPLETQASDALYTLSLHLTACINVQRNFQQKLLDKALK